MIPGNFLQGTHLEKWKNCGHLEASDNVILNVLCAYALLALQHVPFSLHGLTNAVQPALIIGPIRRLKHSKARG
jgi:hypothetical protein